MTTADRKPGEWITRDRSGYRRALRILGVIALFVFLAETAVMFILPHLPPMERVGEALVDSSILIVLLSPTFYFFLLQPLLQHIRAQTAAEAELRRSRHMLQTVFDGIADPLVLMDDACRVKMLNAAACRYFGVEGDQVMGRTCREAFPQEFEACGNCRVPEVAKRESRLTAFERQSPRDPARVEQVVAYQTVDEERGEGSVIMRISDITEAKAMERHLVQREKMASLGLLISGVAHEINNPNNFIIFNLPILRDYLNELLPLVDAYQEEHGGAEFLNMTYPEFRKDLDKLIDNIEHGATRIDGIVSQLKEFSRLRQRQAVGTMDPRAVIDKAVNICGGEIKRRVRRFVVEAPERLPEIQGDPQALEQILINLLINAAQAADKDDSWVRLTAEEGTDRHARLRLVVADNGSGMDAETQKHIFDPLFTTKDPQTGTGLGLYVCHNLVESLGGRIQVASRPGEGSEIQVLLPERSPSAAPRPGGTADTPGR